MTNFIIFFEGKEGTSPLVRLLDRFEDVDVVHQEGDRGWEPFDPHNCGPMPLASLVACLEHVWGDGPVAMDALNAIYRRTGTRALHPFRRENAVGFKMRFQPAARGFGTRIVRRLSPRLAARVGDDARFRDRMIDVLRRHDVTVLLAVRQDLLRWALSQYHGDGTGKPGNLQFRLAKGELRREDLGRIRVDCDRLGRLIEGCRASHARRRALSERFQAAGLRVHTLRYEDFLADRRGYFRELGGYLGRSWDEAAIDVAFAGGAHFEKVHAHDLSTWVVNHAEVEERFGDAFESFDGETPVCRNTRLAAAAR